MGFDFEKFQATYFVAREDAVSLPDLKEFFGEDKPEWKVRGLNGIELAKAKEAVARNKNISSIIDGLSNATSKSIKKAIEQYIGGPDDVPDDIAYRVDILRFGSVEPKVDYPLATKLCEAFPIEFFEITNRIIKLSGQGHIPGKVPPSGKTTKSAPR